MKNKQKKVKLESQNENSIILTKKHNRFGIYYA